MFFALNDNSDSGPRHASMHLWLEVFEALGHHQATTDAAELLISPLAGTDGQRLRLSPVADPARSITVCLPSTQRLHDEVWPPFATINATSTSVSEPAGDPLWTAADTRLDVIVSPDADPSSLDAIHEALATMPNGGTVVFSLDATGPASVFVELDEMKQPGDSRRVRAVDAAAAGFPIVGAAINGSGFVEHGITGLEVSPDSAGISWAFRHLTESPRDRSRLALNAQRRTNVQGDRLLDGLIHDLLSPALRRRVVIINTFAVDTPVNGGQRRLRQLAGELARVADVELLVLSQHADVETRRLLAPGLTQIEIPRSAEQKDAEDKIFDLLGEPTDDMTAADLAATTPAWAALLDERLPECDLIVSCHPYLAPTIPVVDGIAFVYDSYNAETSFKRSVLDNDDNGAWLLAATERAERNATQRADLIVACTGADLDEIRRLDDDHHDGVVVSNGVDVDALPFATDEQRQRARWELLDLAGLDPFSDRPIATFIGSSHAPNLSAAELLIATARRRPDWLFILAGSHSSVFAEQQRPLPDNVTLVPVFDEGLLWPLIAGADVAANPMVSGGGSNLKIFDYLAVGSPVLATPTGARGLDNPSSLVELVEPTVDGVVGGLDRLVDPAGASQRAERSAAGRAFVEAQVSWQTLGAKWSTALGELVGGWIGEKRPRLDTSQPIILLDRPPPAADPAIATMQRVGAAAADGAPTSREITVDPAFREHIRKAKTNRKVGRELPDGARMALPKKALIRAGHALSNEQVVYNEASIAAMERLMDVINDLRRDQLALTERLEVAETALANSAHAPATTTSPVVPPAPAAPATDTPALDAFYEAFEDSFRGDPADVASSTAHYLERIADAPDGPVVDVGCGRGEWLGLVAATGRRALGFDTNAVAVERCVADGRDATHGDGIAHLESVSPGSVAVISAFHVIEHLEFDQLHRFALAAHRALIPGGKLVLETPNCLNLQVGASSFWLDPTHISPVHPEQLRFLLSHVGFDTVDVFGLHPDEGSTPTDLDADPARNGLLTEFHRLVFSSVDLAAIATKA